MRGADKTKKRLINEVQKLRRRTSKSKRTSCRRKQVEETLPEIKERYKALFDRTLYCVYVHDFEGRFLDANRAALNLLGYKKKEIPSLNFSVLLDKDQSREAFKIIEEIKQAGSQRQASVYKLRKKDGDSVWVETEASVIYKRGKPFAVQGIARDITDRILMQESLQGSEDLFRSVVDNSYEGILIVDDAFKIIYCNDELCRILGYSREEIVDQDFRNFLADESRATVVDHYIRRQKGEWIPSQYEFSIVRKNGEKRTVEIRSAVIKDSSRKIKTLAQILDITEQKRGEKIKDSIYKISEAAHSAQNLEELFRSIHNIIGELMPAKNFYIALYDYDREILSFPYFADEYDETPAPKRLGKGLTEYVLRTGEPLLASPDVFKELVKKGEAELIGAPSIDWLGVPLKRDNKTFGVLVVQSYTEGVRFGEEDKGILKFVSGQAAMAIRRKHAEEQLKQSLRDKGVLLQEVHHRVKNNMQIISSLLNLQASQVKDKDFLKMVKDSQSRIRSIALIHEKLYKSQNFSNINFSDYVQSLVIHLFQFNQIDSNLIQLKMDLEEVFLDIQTAIPCGLILNELVTNSMKHAFPEGRRGEITVGLHPLEEHSFQIVVRDNGVGIPKNQDIEHTTTLGLQIVTMLVKQIEGSMEVQREDGTTVKIVFKKLR